MSFLNTLAENGPPTRPRPIWLPILAGNPSVRRGTGTEASC